MEKQKPKKISSKKLGIFYWLMAVMGGGFLAIQTLTFSGSAVFSPRLNGLMFLGLAIAAIAWVIIFTILWLKCNKKN